jgi:hypothetical protein
MTDLQRNLLRAAVDAGKLTEQAVTIPGKRILARLVTTGLLRRVECEGAVWWEITDRGRVSLRGQEAT